MKKAMTPTARLAQYFKTGFRYEISAALLFSAGIAVFSAPNAIVGGGVSGIASILYTLFGLPIGAVSLCMNIPLLILGYRALGRTFILNTLRVSAMVSACMDIVSNTAPPYRGQPLLAALAAGVLCGAGLATVMMRGYTTGGTDILVKLIQKKRPYLSLGKIVLLTDMAVVFAAALCYKSLDTVLYGAVMIYASSAVIDAVVLGADAKKLAFIVTQKEEQVTKALLNGLSRGVTVLKGQGGYSKEPKTLLLCVVSPRELFLLKRLVAENDERAFIIITKASETLGQGFKGIAD